VPAGANVDVVRDLVSHHLPAMGAADIVLCGEGVDNVNSVFGRSVARLFKR
jgi:hypothetical protein